MYLNRFKTECNPTSIDESFSFFCTKLQQHLYEQEQLKPKFMFCGFIYPHLLLSGSIYETKCSLE